MIEFDDVTFAYSGRDIPVLRNVSCRIAEGEFCLVLGPTGSGKSTFLGCVNNLVPRFTGGARSGRIRIGGTDTTLAQPRELAALIGYVGQDPLAGFVTDTVEQELAYSMEQLGFSARLMRTRVEETLDLLGIADLRARPLRTLSGGQQQRVAIGASLAASPAVLVLDEPTSALDPAAAEEVLALIQRLVHDLGTTVLIAEHRMERVVEFADSAALVTADGAVLVGDIRRVLGAAPIRPPLVEIGHQLGWLPLPVNIRDGRRHAASLRALWDERGIPRLDEPEQGSVVLGARGVVVRYGDVIAVSDVDFSLRQGEVCALMGRNGSGKSSLLWALHGAGRKDAGKIDLNAKGRHPVALVPQTASDLLYLESVTDECREMDEAAELAPGTVLALLRDLVGDVPPEAHPRDLSEGQKLALVLALQLASSPSVVLLDEPTRGLDYAAKSVLRDYLGRLAARGHAVVVATHDVEFAAMCCARVVLMAAGEIVADGMARDVLADSPLLATQAAKMASPHQILTVEEFVDAARSR